jgi:hypothetical protein
MPAYLNNKCPGANVDSTYACGDNDYVYTYRKISWFEALAGFINAFARAAAGGAGGLEKLLNWLSEHGMTAFIIFVVILSIVFLGPPLIELIKNL